MNLNKIPVTMIDVSNKNITLRTAEASCIITLQAATLECINAGQIKKGDAYEVARVAGIMAAKNTPNFLPLCHPIKLSSAAIEFHPIDACHFEIRSHTKAHDVTGVEMEALVSVTAAALCIYDMCKYLDKAITISTIQLLSKTGGKSGDYKKF